MAAAAAPPALLPLLTLLLMEKRSAVGCGGPKPMPRRVFHASSASATAAQMLRWDCVRFGGRDNGGW